MYINPEQNTRVFTDKIADVDMCYYDNRLKNDKTPVVFLHGFPFSHKMWKFQLSEIGRSRRVIAPDLRGFGCTGIGDGQYTMDLYAEDVNLLMEKLNIREAVICGLSMGGYVALRMFQKFPQRFAGMILCDTKSMADTDAEKEKRIQTIQKIREKGLEGFADDFLKSVFWEENFSFKNFEIEMARNIIMENNPVGVKGALLAMAARTDTSDVLRSIDVPTLILGGDHDKLSSPSVSIWLHDHIRSSEMHLVKRAGHLSNLENAYDFNKYLNQFLETTIN